VTANGFSSIFPLQKVTTTVFSLRQESDNGKLSVRKDLRWLVDNFEPTRFRVECSDTDVY